MSPRRVTRNLRAPARAIYLWPTWSSMVRVGTRSSPGQRLRRCQSSPTPQTIVGSDIASMGLIFLVYTGTIRGRRVRRSYTVDAVNSLGF